MSRVIKLGFHAGMGMRSMFKNIIERISYRWYIVRLNYYTMMMDSVTSKKGNEYKKYKNKIDKMNLE